MKKVLVALISLLLIIQIYSREASETHKLSIPLRFDFYYSYDMIINALNLLQKKYPRLSRLDLVGKTEEGRDIYCMTINNLKTGHELDKPGVYVDGNIHGNEIQGTEVCLYLINYLLTKYGKNKEITELVDKNCFYIVPMVNPDGRYHFLSEANTASSNRGLRIPMDDDNDGLVDEDFPDDLDGDGNICMMRKRDPYGNFKTDTEDPRLMKRIKPGEQGEWTLLGYEGIDNDGDGKINEDGEGYVDANRNWGYDWMPPYVQEGAGEYPFSGKGLKALAVYIRKRPNICIAWTFHNYGGMYLRGPSTKAQPEYAPQDIAVYDYLGEQAEKISPGYRYLISWKDLYSTHGDSGEWMSMIMGAYTFVGEIYMSRQESFKSFKESKLDKPDDEDDFSFRGDLSFERERLKFNDHLTQGELFKPWEAYQHPLYGAIEIGGWVKMSSRLPDPFLLLEMLHRNASVVIFSAKNTPEVTFDVFEVKKIDSGLIRVRTRLANTKSIPSMSYHAQEVKLYPKDFLKLSGKNLKVIAGGQINDLYHEKISYKEYCPEIQFFVVPGFGKIEHQFLVDGKGILSILYHSYHAGKLEKRISLD